MKPNIVLTNLRCKSHKEYLTQSLLFNPIITSKSESTLRKNYNYKIAVFSRFSSSSIDSGSGNSRPVYRGIEILIILKMQNSRNLCKLWYLSLDVWPGQNLHFCLWLCPKAFWNQLMLEIKLLQLNLVGCPTRTESTMLSLTLSNTISVPWVIDDFGNKWRPWWVIIWNS